MMNFEKIKSEYNRFYQDLLKNGKKPLRSTKVGLWGHYPCEKYHEFFKKIHLEKYKNFIDLGSGDGKVVMIASLFTKSSGIEFDIELYNKSLEIKKKLGIKCELYNSDFQKVNISKYDFVFINPDKGFKFMEKDIIKTLNGKLFVANNIFQPRFLEKGKSTWIDGIPFIEFTKLLNNSESD